ncbi:MAG: hypothetical protein WCT54_00735 [Patescibacteria group bacterium]
MPDVRSAAEAETFASDEVPTPVCNLFKFTREHWEAQQQSYDMLRRHLHMPAMRAPRFSVDAGSARLFREIQTGTRQLCWCPKGVDLFAGLFPFFAKRRIGLMLPAAIGPYLLSLSATAHGAWIAWSHNTLPSENSSNGGSGIFSSLPSAVHLVYLLARSIALREDGFDRDGCQANFASPDTGNRLFLRTSSVTDKTTLGVAYSPGEAIRFQPFSAGAQPPNLVTPNAFLL